MTTQSKNRIAIALTVVVLIVAGVVLSASAIAQRARHREGPHRAFMMHRVARELGLTEEQKAQIKEILKAEAPTVKPILKELGETHRELRSATENGQFDEAQIRALAQKQGESISELIVEKERVKTKIYAVLTPEQRAKAAEMIDRLESRIREHIERGAGF